MDYALIPKSLTINKNRQFMRNLATIATYPIHSRNYVMQRYMKDILVPVFARMAQIRFGESNNRHLYCADDQANRMINKIAFINYFPAQVFIKWIYVQMIHEYLITGAVNIRYNNLHLLEVSYWDNINEEVPLFRRPIKLIAEHSEVVFEYACIIPRSELVMPDVDDLGGDIRNHW